jgi:hypothetical protein
MWRRDDDDVYQQTSIEKSGAAVVCGVRPYASITKCDVKLVSAQSWSVIGAKKLQCDEDLKSVLRLQIHCGTPSSSTHNSCFLFPALASPLCSPTTLLSRSPLPGSHTWPFTPSNPPTANGLNSQSNRKWPQLPVYIAIKEENHRAAR